MNNLLLSVVGPTASGKTKLALDLAKLFCQTQGKKAYLISADSRQVYQELPILTGADIPADFTQANDPALAYPFYQHQTWPISLHGIGIIKADQEWSVGHFQNLAWPIIRQAWQEQALVILVGGTGLYHLQLFNQDPQLKVLPDEKVRNQAEKMTVEQLQAWLKEINPQHLSQLNHSDLHNPRRLIRAIEISLALNQGNHSAVSQTKIDLPSNFSQLIFYLELDLETIKARIAQRIEARWLQGVAEEVKKMFKKAHRFKLNLGLLSATGVKEIQNYLNGEIDQDNCSANWLQAEFSYAKRQLTWWKKRSGLVNLDAQQKNLTEKAWQIVLKHLS